MGKKVSVIMGAYNEKIEWLENSVNSILNQSYRNIEFIVILDNPDNIEIKNFMNKLQLKDNRIRFYVNEKNLGLVKTLNKAIGLSNGEYIARMDADDIALPDRIKLQVNFLDKNAEIDLVGSKIEYIDENDNVISKDKYRPCGFEDIKRHLKYYNAFAHPTLMYRTDVLRKLNGYNEIYCAEDYDLVTRFVVNGYKTINLNNILLKYRVRSNGISQSNRTKQYITSEYIKEIYRKSIKGENKKFDENYLISILENKKINKLYDDYLNALENFEKDKSAKNIIALFKVYTNNKYAFKGITEKVFYAIKRKL